MSHLTPEPPPAGDRFATWSCADDAAAAMSPDYGAVKESHKALSDLLCRVESDCEQLGRVARWIERLNEAGEADAGHAVWADEFSAKITAHVEAIEALALDGKALLRMNGARA